MNAITFGTAYSYLQGMPCGLKQELFDHQLRPLCESIYFIGKQTPLIMKRQNEVIGLVEEITVVDQSTREFLKVSVYDLYRSMTEKKVKTHTNLKQIMGANDPRLDELKLQGYKEVGDASKR